MKQSLLLSDNALKHKLVFIGGHLVHKFGDPDADYEEVISTEFLFMYSACQPFHQCILFIQHSICTSEKCFH